ncbi:hypothetical protein ABPG73_004756 [Tetrahymena malaccensis]
MRQTLKKLDIFSSSFQFNLGHKQPNKGTLTGFALSSFVILTTIAYFIYEIVLFEYPQTPKQESKNQNDFQSINQINLYVKNDNIKSDYMNNLEIINGDKKKSIELIESNLDQSIENKGETKNDCIKFPDFQYKSKQHLDHQKNKQIVNSQIQYDLSEKNLYLQEKELTTKREDDLYLKQGQSNNQNEFDDLQKEQKNNQSINQVEENTIQQRENVVINFDNQCITSHERSPQNQMMKGENTNNKQNQKTVIFNQMSKQQIVYSKGETNSFFFNDRKNQESNNLNYLHNNINKLKALQSKSLTKQVMKKVFSFNILKKKNEQISNNLGKQERKVIFDQLNQDLNIFSFFKDIIFLKKAVMLMLDSQQLAAIQLLGFSSDFLDLDLNNLTYSDLEQLTKDKKLSYLEEQFITYQSDEIQQQKLSQFLQRLQNQEKGNDIDYRILHSMP